MKHDEPCDFDICGECDMTRHSHGSQAWLTCGAFVFCEEGRCDICVPRPQVGWWFAVCCTEDLRQIDDEQMLTNALELQQVLPQAKFWQTRADALRELKCLTHSARASND